MREIVLRDFFLGRITAAELASDVLGSVRQVGPMSFEVEIEDMEAEFSVTREMLISLCDAVISGKLPAPHLSSIGFTLIASDKFLWDGDDVGGEIIHDWSCPEINYPLTIENVQRFKNWLLGLQQYPAKPKLSSPPPKRLISRTEKKALRKP